MNPYLKRLREQYEGLRSGIDGLQTRAAEENRDLTETELRSVQDQGKQAESLYKQIEDLTEIETRNAKVAQMAGQIASATAVTNTGQPMSVRAVGGATTQDRDPGHYRSVNDGGQFSFFADMYKSKELGDEAAARRLVEHNRALSTGTHGPGVVPPRWMSDEFEQLARQGRALANAVRRIPVSDAAAITLPKQTAGTDSVVAEQASENTAVGGTDAWDSDVDTVTPKPTAGKQTVSRQLLESSSPAIDQLIYGDLIAVYNDKVEAKVGAAVLAAAGTAVVTLATESVFVTGGYDAVIDTAMAVRTARKRPADLLVMTTARWGRFKKLKDTTNRPLIPASTAGPVNVFGVGTVAADGQIDELPIVVTDGLTTAAYPDSVIAMRASDTLLFEGNMLRFRYEEVAGPESIVLGIWAYTAVIVRQAGKSVKRFQVTAA